MNIKQLHNRIHAIFSVPTVILSSRPVCVNGKPYDGSALQGNVVVDGDCFFAFVSVKQLDGADTLPVSKSTKHDAAAAGKTYKPCCGGNDNSPYNWNAPKAWNGGAWTQYVQPKENKPQTAGGFKKGAFAELLANAHIRCIHMPERIDREMIMQEAFRRLGIAGRKDLFFQAVDGAKQKNTSGMRTGNWGCALSKAAIMKEAAERKRPLFLLEDDVVISPQVHEIMDSCLAELPADWKVLYLGYVALEPHETMPTKGLPKRDKKGKWHEILANANLNHALLIRDTKSLLELSQILADPETYKRDEGRFTSDYTVAQYFAHKGIPMYGVVPAVAKQCTTYSDNEKKVINRKAMFDTVPDAVLNRKWEITGKTQFPMEWGVERLLPADWQDKGYLAVKIHPPFDVTLTLSEKSEVAFVLLTTSRVQNEERLQINISGNSYGGAVEIPGYMGTILEPGNHRLTCEPKEETWRWKHVALLVREPRPGDGQSVLVIDECETVATPSDTHCLP